MNKGRLLIILSLIFLLSWSFSVHKWTYNEGGFAIFSWDACGYYSYLPALFYDDIYAPEKVAATVMDQHLMGDMVPFHYHEKTGRAVMRFPIGEAIAFSPAFLIAHLLDKEHTGYSLTYSYAMGAWGIVIALLGIYFLYRVLIRYYSLYLTGLLIACYIFATNYLQYAAVDLMHTHSLLFTMYGGLLLMADNAFRREDLSKLRLLSMGMLVGWMAITRPTEVLAILVPLLWGVSSIPQLRERFRYWTRNLGKLSILALGVFISSFIQLLYWKLCTDQWVYNSYKQDFQFSFLHPHLRLYLFSYAKGWFVYTPIMILSFIGLYWMLRDKKNSAVMIALYIIPMVYILASWDNWWYGGSFTQRSIVQSYVLLALPMTYFIQRLQLKKWSRYLYLFIFLFAAYTNINLHYLGDHSHYYETEAINKKYFWRTLWTWNKPDDYKKFFDIDYEMPVALEPSLKQVYNEDFSTWSHGDDSIFHSPSRAYLSLAVDSAEKICQLKIPPSTEWVRAVAWIYMPELNWNPWQLFEMQLQQGEDDGTPAQILKPQRYIHQAQQWIKVYWDLAIDKDATQEIIVTFNNKMPGIPFLVDDLSLWIYEKPTR